MGGENLSGLKIILDTCYGSATTCAKEIFQSLGADVRVINDSQNGLKINMNCGSTNLEPLKKALRESPADMGFSFDGDADRVIGIDSKDLYLFFGRSLSWELIYFDLTPQLIFEFYFQNFC